MVDLMQKINNRAYRMDQESHDMGATVDLIKILEDRTSQMEDDRAEMDEMRQFLEVSANTIETAQNALDNIDKYKKEIDDKIRQAKQDLLVLADKRISEIKLEAEALISKVKRVVGPQGPAGEDGLDGETPEVDYNKIIKEVVKKIPKPKDGKDGKDGKSVNPVQLFGSGGGIKVQSNGVGIKQDQTSNTMNFIGSATPTYNANLQRWDIAISGSGSGTNTTVESLTGTVGGGNVTFTVAHTPVFLTQMGQVLFEGVDYTLATLTITFNSAPTEGDILRSIYNA